MRKNEPEDMGGCEAEQPAGWYCTRDFHHNGPCATKRLPAAPSVEQDERGLAPTFGIPLYEDMRRALEHVECVYRLNFVADGESSSTLANLQRVIKRIHTESVEQDERGAVKCRELALDDMDQLIVWLGQHERDEIGHQGLCDLIVGAFAARAASTSDNVAQGDALSAVADDIASMSADELRAEHESHRHGDIAVALRELSANVAQGALNDGDVFTLIGHAEFLRAEGQLDMPNWFLQLAGRIATHIGDSGLANRVTELLMESK